MRYAIISFGFAESLSKAAHQLEAVDIPTKIIIKTFN